MTPFEPKALIEKSWERVKQGAHSNKSRGQTHGDRATAWINCLGEAFQEVYPNEDQRVFWRNNGCNKDFKLNELLFDISVCQIGCVKSIVKRKPLPYIQKCLWQVESEFNGNSREVIKDFSKLVMGRSENKLFVSSYQGERQKQALRMFSKVASSCGGILYVCFLEHPRKWSKGPKNPSLFKWEGNCWIPL